MSPERKARIDAVLAAEITTETERPEFNAQGVRLTYRVGPVTFKDSWIAGDDGVEYKIPDGTYYPNGKGVATLNDFENGLAAGHPSATTRRRRHDPVTDVAAGLGPQPQPGPAQRLDSYMRSLWATPGRVAPTWLTSARSRRSGR